MIFVRHLLLTFATLAGVWAADIVALKATAFGELPERDVVLLRSTSGHGGGSSWRMVKQADIKADGAAISAPGFATMGWTEAIVPGTALNTLVAAGVYPEPYFGLNNAHELKLIPDAFDVGAAFYTCWWRTEFNVPTTFAGRRVWIQLDGINYRAEVWLNGRKLGDMAGMFKRGLYDITEQAKVGGANALAVLIKPIDPPNGFRAKRSKPIATGENRNGADGNIGTNTTMLMTAGWDFTFSDGIRDRNTGIWRDVKLFASGPVVLRHAFVTSKLPLPDLSSATLQIAVDASNATHERQEGVLTAQIPQLGITLEKTVVLEAGQTLTVSFTAADHAQLKIAHPRLWWPLNKGEQVLNDLVLTFTQKQIQSDRIVSRFGIREITSDRNTPDQSRCFYVNGQRLFLHGTNWVPEAMCRTSAERTWAELRYTRQAGINFIRLWAGGVAESDQFFDICDELGMLVWIEFWQSGDCQIPKTPDDVAIYRANAEDTIKRLRNHSSLAYYVSANERDAKGIVPLKDLLDRLDGTRGWQPGSETDGVHDGSPYTCENPMFYYEDTASGRGSRINGLCPEYGCPITPTVDCLREMMDEKDLWPINRPVWDYLDGGAFHGMTGNFQRCVEQYGPSNNIEEYAFKGQIFGGLAFRALWECWNANRFEYGDRFSTGVLFWYNNCPNRQTCARLYDWSLEPTAALYFSQNAHQPLHAQFDFLKNTVSINNELTKAFPGYHLDVRILNLDMSVAFSRRLDLDIPADRLLKDVLTLEFAAGLSPVHFIRLDVADAGGKPVASTFYWRSTNPYKPGRTWSGPEYAGFADLARLPEVELTTAVTAGRRDGRNFTTVTVTNPGPSLAFMVWLRLQDAATAKPIRPAFYDDNFVSLLPGETRSIVIDYSGSIDPATTRVVVDGWNIARRAWYNGTWSKLSSLPRTTPPAPSLTFKKVVTASSSDGEATPAKAVDNDSSTRWASARGKDDQWLAVDLGSLQTIGEISLTWEAAYAKEYKLQVSDDGNAWSDVVHVTDGKGNIETHTITPVKTRHVRMLGITRASAYGFSLWEFEVRPPRK